LPKLVAFLKISKPTERIPKAEVGAQVFSHQVVAFSYFLFFTSFLFLFSIFFSFFFFFFVSVYFFLLFLYYAQSAR